MQKQPHIRCLLFHCSLLLMASSCTTEFSAATIKGTWKTAEVRITDDDCQLQDSFTTSLAEQVYITGTAQEDGEQFEEEITTDVIADLQQNIWSHCIFEGTPTFYCDFPLQIIHLESWKAGLEPLLPESDEGALCSSELISSEAVSLAAIRGDSNGIFLTQNTAFMESRIEILCQPEIPICSSNLSIDLIR